MEGLPSIVPVASDVDSVVVGSVAVVVSNSERDSGVEVVEKSSSKLNAAVVEDTDVDAVAPLDSVPLSAARVEVTGLSNVAEIVELVLVV